MKESNLIKICFVHTHIIQMKYDIHLAV